MKNILFLLLLISSEVKSQTITTIVGGGSLGDGDSAIYAGLSYPYQLWFDTLGSMYVAESGSNRIRKIKDGIISTFAGTGSAGYFGDGGVATNAMLNANSGVVGDRNGNIYITEFYNNRLRVVNSFGIINLFAGNGTSGWLGDGYPATSAEISAPTEMCIDTFGSVYFADAGCQGVRKISPSGMITTIAGDGSIFPGYGGDGGPATLALFHNPTGVAVDYTGNLYIADFDNNRIRKVTTDGIVNTIAGCSSTGYYSGDGGPATLARLNEPYGIFVDNHTGNVYWTERGNNVVRKLTPDGIISTVAGTGVLGFSGDGGPATDAKLFYPGYVCMDNCGNLIISDTYNNRIRKVTYPFAGTLPAISVATAHDTLCAGVAATFASTLTTGSPGGLSYRWYVNGVATAATSSTYTYTPGNGDSVRCVLTYTNTCAGIVPISSNTIFMTVDSTVLPAITASASTDTLCAGATATVGSTLTLGSPGGISYQWFVNGSGTSATSSTYTYVPDNGDSVRCVLTYTNACTGTTLISSNTIHFVVDSTEIPSISLPALTYSVTGSVVTVNAVVAISGSATPTYIINWYNHGIYFATTAVPTVTYTKTEPIDSITATVIPTGTPCYDSAQSSAYLIEDSALAISSLKMTEYENLKIYPNPAQETVTIAAQQQMRQMTLTNIYGKVVYHKSVNTCSATIDISQLPSGMYFVEINGVVSGRFLKQ